MPKRFKQNSVTRYRKGLDRLFHPSVWFDPQYTVTEYYDVEMKQKRDSLQKNNATNFRED